MYGYSPAVPIGQLIVALLFGGLLGAIFSDRAAPYRKYLWYALGVLIVWGSYHYFHEPYTFVPLTVFFIIGFIVAKRLLALALAKDAIPGFDDVYGTATFANIEHLQENDLIEPLEAPVREIDHGY